MMTRKIPQLAAAMILILFMQGCVPVLIGGAATTAGILHDRRSAGTIVDDNALEIKIKGAIETTAGLGENSHVNVTGYNGLILLTGEAANETVRQQIEHLAQNVAGAHRVINQVVIGRPSTISERAYDTKQTAKVKAAVLSVRLPNFDGTKVKVVTEHGYTYLMGIVTKQEADAVINVARRVSGVKEIVSLFEVVGVNYVPPNY